MSLFLKRHFWVLPGMVVAICALFAARIVNEILEARAMAAGTPHHVHARAAHPRTTVAAAVKDADGLVARNMFCSSCEPGGTPLPPGPVDTNVVAGEAVPVTTLPLALVGTIMTSHVGDSSATIANTKTLRSGSYGVKDRIPGAGEIVLIGPQVVHFMNDASHHVERIDLVAAAPKPPGPPTTSTPVHRADVPPAAGPESELVAMVDQGVHKVDDTHYTLDRTMVDKILLDPTQLARSVRMQPQIADNRTTGWKMGAIRPASPLARIGMQNGDTIVSVNGYDLGSPDKLLEVYAKVRSAQNLSIALLRAGQPVSMEYAIR